MDLTQELYRDICNILEGYENTKQIDDVCHLIDDTLQARNAVLAWQIEELKSLPAEEFKHEVLTLINNQNATQN